METVELIQLVVDRVANCYDKHGLCCSESVVVVLNRVFSAGFEDRAMMQMAAGYCHGIGGAGCSCGSLTGAVMILSTFLGHHQKDGLSKNSFRKGVLRLHDEFRTKFGSTCCRVLSKKVKHDKIQHHTNCLMLTKGGAEIATSILLELRPDLLHVADKLFLLSKEYPITD